jgi:hypothetical protein
MQLSANSATINARKDNRPPRSEEDTARVVEELVATLGKMRRNASLALALDVGALIVDRIFRGDLAAVHERGKRDTTFRMLAAHPHVPFSASTLWRHVRVYELVRRMPRLMRYEHLTITHMQAVLGLSHEQQEQLLHVAETDGWSAARLRQHARQAVNGQRPDSQGKNPVLKTFRRFARLQTELDPESFADLVGNDLAERERILETVTRTRAWCDAMETLLIKEPPTRH